MAKSMDTKKTEKKEPLKTPKEKKAEKREKKANKKQFVCYNIVLQPYAGDILNSSGKRYGYTHY